MHAAALTHSLRLAWRGLRRTPGASIGAALTLCVSFVAVVVLLGVLYGATRPIPGPHGDRMVRIDVLDAHASPVPLPQRPVGEWAHGTGFDGAAGLTSLGGTLVRDGSPAVRTSGAAMEPAAFRLLGVAPARGRWPTTDAADARALVLGWSVFEEFGGTADVIGSEVRIDGVPHTVVGVMPRGFGFPEKHSYWTVLGARDSVEQVVARLAAGFEIPSARAALDVRLRSVAVAQAHAGPYQARVRPWHTGRGEGGEAAAFAGLGVLVAVLVVICAANVSTLLLVRASERAGALAVHAALGATRIRVAGVLFLEALLIALAGGVLGVIAGAFALHWMELRLSQHWGYYWMRMELQPAAIAGVLAVVLAAAVLAGTAPAMRASRIDLREVLAGNGRGGSGRRSRWAGRWFVWVQVSLSTIGLVAALLLGSGVQRLARFSAQLPLDEVATGDLAPGARYTDPSARALLLAELRSELQRIPGARAVALSTALPGMDYTSSPLRLLGDTARDAQRKVAWLGADEGLLATYDVRVLRGRNIRADDAANAQRVALVTAAFAAEHLGGADPIGARIHLDAAHDSAEYAEVVGVVSDWSEAGARGGAARVIVPLAQLNSATWRISVRTAEPEAAVAQLRPAVARADAELALESPQTLRALVAWLLRMPRVLAGFGVIGGITGVLVAAIGLYAVIAFQVRTRLAEFGVRLALGARPAQVLAEVIREALIRVAPGVAVGGTLAFGATQALGFLTRDANLRSPLLYLTTLAIMSTVAGLAALAPALRAARLDPLVIMRRD